MATDSVRGRGAKRKLDQQSTPVSKKSKGELYTPTLPPSGYFFLSFSSNFFLEAIKMCAYQLKLSNFVNELHLNPNNSIYKNVQVRLQIVLAFHAYRFPKEHPFNRDGYRYILAEADPHAPFRQVKEEQIYYIFNPIMQ